jgi:hypothetical protein
LRRRKTSKVDGLHKMTKRSTHVVTCYFENAENPKAG